MEGFSFYQKTRQANNDEETLRKSASFISQNQQTSYKRSNSGQKEFLQRLNSKKFINKDLVMPCGSQNDLQNVFKSEHDNTDRSSYKAKIKQQSSNVGFFKNMFDQPKENENLLALKNLKLDYQIKLNIAFLLYMILSISSDAVILKQLQEKRYPMIILMIAMIIVKSVLIILHGIVILLHRFGDELKKRMHNYSYFWIAFLTIVFTHFQCGLIRKSVPVHDFTLGTEFQIQTLYSFMVLFIMMPAAFLLYTPNRNWFIASLLIEPFPFYLMSNPSFSQASLQLRSTVFFLLMHFAFTWILHSKTMNVKEILLKEIKRAEAYENETQQLLEKMPEGVLIVEQANEEGAELDCDQTCFMNEELGQVLNIIQDRGCHQGKMSREECGLLHKIFRRYWHSEDPNNNEGNHNQTTNKKVNKKEEVKNEFISLQQMIDDNNWKEDEERFFEVILEQDQQSGGDKNQNYSYVRDYTQIRRLNIKYSLKPAIMIVIRNISVIIEFEKEKNENKYQELLTATMSHEMLTPLNSIINLAIYIEGKLQQRYIKDQSEVPGMEGSRGGSTSEKADLKQSLGFLHIIKSSANILQYLIKDLIDLMNIRLNRFVQVTQLFSPTTSCNEVLQFFEIQSKEKGLYLRRTINPEARAKINKVFGDKHRYQQILLNVVQNSVKFTYQGGIDVALDFTPLSAIIRDRASKQDYQQESHNRLLLQQRRTSQSRVEDNNSFCNDCGSVVTSITDSGIGMEESMVDRLFKIFGTVNKGEQSSLITTQGIGLGLTICKQLVEKLGGQIHLTSVPNQGTKVIFSVPINCTTCFKNSLPHHAGNSSNQQHSSLTFTQLKAQMDSQPKNGDYFIDNNFKSYSNHNYGMSLAARYHHNSYSIPLTVKSQTPISKSIIPVISGVKKVLGPDASQNSVTLVMSQNKNIANNTDLKAQMRSSARTEQMAFAREPVYEYKKVFQTASPSSQSQMISRSVIKKLDSINNKAQTNPPSQQVSDQKVRNEGGGTQSISASYRKPGNGRQIDETSKSKSKGAQFSDSRGAKSGIASDFISSSQGFTSINDKITKKAFAAKVMIENTYQFGMRQGTINYEKPKKYAVPEYLSHNIENGIREQEEDSIENKSVQLRQELQESSRISINDEIEEDNQSDRDLTQTPILSRRQGGGYLPMEKMLHQLQLHNLHENDLQKVTRRNRSPSIYIHKGEEDDNVEDDLNLSQAENDIVQSKSQNKNIIQSHVSTEHIQLVAPILYSKNNLDIQEYRDKNQTGYFPVMMQSKISGGQFKSVINKKGEVKNTNTPLIDKEVMINPLEREFEGKNGGNYAQHDNQTNKSGSRICSVSLIPKSGQYGQGQSSSDMTPNFNPNRATDNVIPNSYVRSAGPGVGEYNMKMNPHFSGVPNSEPGGNKGLKPEDKKNLRLSLREPQIQNVKPNLNFNTEEESKYIVQLQDANKNQNGKQTYTFSKVQYDIMNFQKENNVFQKNVHLMDTDQLGSPMVPKFQNTQENQNIMPFYTPQLPHYQEESEKLRRDLEGARNENIVNINLDSDVKGPRGSENTSQEILNTVQVGKDSQGHPTLMERSQKKDCGCESTILIVDDQIFNLIPLQLILTETFQLGVEKALNGLEAVQKYRADLNKKCCNIRYKLILMDLNMPVMDGFTATEQIKSMHSDFLRQKCLERNTFNLHTSTPQAAGSGESSQTIAIKARQVELAFPLTIVAVTAFVNEESIRHCYEVGMSDVIHKPVSAAAIRDIIEQFYFKYCGFLHGDEEDEDDIMRDEASEKNYSTQLIPPPLPNLIPNYANEE